MTAEPAAGLVFVARRRFGPGAGDRWRQYLAWSGLGQLRELVSLDEILCPTMPAQLIPADWAHNVRQDYRIFQFRSLEYLRSRVSGESDLNLLALLREPSPGELAGPLPSGFGFAGFDVVDVHGDVSALTNCGGFPRVFAGAELNQLGLVQSLERACEIRDGLRAAYPREPHAACHVWAIWRWRDREDPGGSGSPENH
jgi:hypothetical protein